MKVTVQFEAQLRQVAAINELQVELPDRASVNSALLCVCEQLGEPLHERLLTADGQVRPSVMVFVNDRPVVSSVNEPHQLIDGDVVLLLPPISGG